MKGTKARMPWPPMWPKGSPPMPPEAVGLDRLSREAWKEEEEPDGPEKPGYSPPVREGEEEEEVLVPLCPWDSRREGAVLREEAYSSSSPTSSRKGWLAFRLGAAMPPTP